MEEVLFQLGLRLQIEFWRRVNKGTNPTIKEKHGGIKVSMYMNNLMADCGPEESIKILCSSCLVYALETVIFAFLSF